MNQRMSPDAAPATGKGRLGPIREWTPALLFLLLILVARSTLADHYHVPSGSMEPSLLPGDHVLVDKAAYGWRLPFTKTVLFARDRARPGDVVIFDSPEDGVRLIKRVVAVGGQEVAVRNGRVHIDGQDRSANLAAIESYGDRRVSLRLDHGGGPALRPVLVPEGHVLVLGDHRGNSRDGRWFGFVPEKELYGRAEGVFWRTGQGPGWYGL